jgi:hypothetical protein
MPDRHDAASGAGDIAMILLVEDDVAIGSSVAQG